MKILRVLLSLIITLLLPLSAAEYLYQYRGGFDLRSLFAHQPLLVIGAALSFVLTILLVIPSRKRQELASTTSDSALVLLSLLQEQGRLLDFVSEDITPFNDTQVSSAARVVHAGCRKVILEYYSPAPVAASGEGSVVQGIAGPELTKFRLVGKVGKAPYSGKILHRGWRVTKNVLPSRSEQSEILAPAELEVANG